MYGSRVSVFVLVYTGILRWFIKFYMYVLMYTTPRIRVVGMFCAHGTHRLSFRYCLCIMCTVLSRSSLIGWCREINIYRQLGMEFNLGLRMLAGGCYWSSTYVGSAPLPTPLAPSGGCVFI